MDTTHERKTYGTHAPDVLGVWGAPEEMSDGRWVYEWRKTDGTTVSVAVTFEAADLCQRSGAKVTPGQYVTDIEATGVAFQKCWDPALNNEKPDCPECLNTMTLVQCSQ